MMREAIITERVYGVRSPYVWFVRDEPSDTDKLEFHVKSGDYFLMLAGALGFIEEALAECETGKAASGKERDIVRNLRNELVHLHKNYRIEEGGKSFTDRTIHRFDQSP